MGAIGAVAALGSWALCVCVCVKRTLKGNQHEAAVGPYFVARTSDGRICWGVKAW